MLSFNKNDLSDFVGKHFVFTYDNGWSFEIYIKALKTIDFRVHSGIVGNRWLKNQEVYIARIAEDIYKISWTERTGTNVSIIINYTDMLYQGTLFFPRWIINTPKKAANARDEQSPLIELYREAGPTYPIEILDEFAKITFIEDRGLNDETVIACAAHDLPKEILEHIKLLT